MLELDDELKQNSGPTLPERQRTWLKKGLGYALRGLLGFLLLSPLLVLLLRVVDPPVWSWRMMRALSPPESYPAEPQHAWRNGSDLADNLRLAVLAAEDQRFAEHNGFDMDAIRAAMDHNARGRTVRGASTLSQQTAKNLFLWSGRSWLRKGLEVWFTLWIELLWDKERILEVYLNIVEFGPGIYGAEAASQHYFGKPARALSRREAARLAAVLPNPYVYKVKGASAYVARRASWIERQMRQLGQEAVQRVEE